VAPLDIALEAFARTAGAMLAAGFPPDDISSGILALSKPAKFLFQSTSNIFHSFYWRLLVGEFVMIQDDFPPTQPRL
jgi:hypothetical protein